MILDNMDHTFYIVMEKMDKSLIALLDSRAKRPFAIENMKLILYQILSGLSHIHENGFLHRDIKPENILVTKVPVPPRALFNGGTPYMDAPYSMELNRSFDNNAAAERQYNNNLLHKDFSSYIIKLTDFGLTREAYCGNAFTEYVSTRWYRAPEILLRSGRYGLPVDIWAFGTMAVEMSTFKALFPGKNEPDQIHLLVQGLGTPSSRNVGGKWPVFKSLTKQYDFANTRAQTTLGSQVHPLHLGLENIIDPCLKWNPEIRPTAKELMQGRFFDECKQALGSLFLMRHPVSSAEIEPQSPRNHLNLNGGPFEHDRPNLPPTPISMAISNKHTHELSFSQHEAVKKQKGEYPQLNVKLSSSPLKVPSVCPTMPKNWNNTLYEEETGVSESGDHRPEGSLTGISQRFLPETEDIDVLEGGMMSLNRLLNSGSDDPFGRRAKCSTPDSFHTAKTNFSVFEPGSEGESLQGNTHEMSKLDGALKRVDNVINILAAPISPTRSVMVKEGTIVSTSSKYVGQRYKYVGLKKSLLDSDDSETELALKKLNKQLDSI